MGEPRLLLFQEGIPGTFLPFLEKSGDKIIRFPTAGMAAAAVFREHPGADAIFFRANFSLGVSALNLLPRLKLAALVSTGADNVDAAALSDRGIPFVSGAGANARAVFDYVIQALLFGGFRPNEESVGVVGAGRIGQMLLAFFRQADIRCAHFDPLVADPGSLGAVLECDFVTFHTPLTKGTTHATTAMLDQGYFAAAQKKLRIIQTCRGGIWQRDFYERLPLPGIEILAQDVYPHEPPAAADLQRAAYSTPHIAGYSTLGRLGGIVNGIKALYPDFSATSFLPEGSAWFLDAEAAALAAAPAQFNLMRDQYPWRKEFHEYDAVEREQFRRRFPAVPGRFFSLLWESK